MHTHKCPYIYCKKPAEICENRECETLENPLCSQCYKILSEMGPQQLAKKLNIKHKTIRQNFIDSIK